MQITHPADSFLITQEILRMIAEVDEFKGAWKPLLGKLAPEKLTSLKKVVMIESVGFFDTHRRGRSE